MGDFGESPVTFLDNDMHIIARHNVKSNVIAGRIITTDTNITIIDVGNDLTVSLDNTEWQFFVRVAS